MKHKLKLLWYYIETRYVKLLSIFGIRRSASVIPLGQYCYVWDEERNTKELCSDGGYWIKTCKYFRGTPKTGGIACTYTGFFGFDICLYDRCKMCGENDEIDKRDLS
jgi:hypothetical protein